MPFPRHPRHPRENEYPQGRENEYPQSDAGETNAVTADVRPAQTRGRGLLWIAVVLCAALGVFAAIGRSMSVSSFGARVEPLRLWVLEATGREDGAASDRALHVRVTDAKYGSHHVLTRLHVLPGALFMLLAPFQLVKAIRSRRPALHRWNGRVVVTAGLLSVLPSFYFGIMAPLGGRAESVVIAAVGAMFIVSFAKAIAAIRRRDVATHREWMLRALAIAFGISVVRLVVIPLDFSLAPSGISTSTLFMLAIVAGWSISIGVAEWWIRATRPAAALRETSG